MHLPEFTMVEWYRTEAGYLEVADDLENMIRRLSRKVFERTRISTACGTVDIADQWQHLSVSEAFMAYVGIDLVDSA